MNYKFLQIFSIIVLEISKVLFSLFGSATQSHNIGIISITRAGSFIGWKLLQINLF